MGEPPDFTAEETVTSTGPENLPTSDLRTSPENDGEVIVFGEEGKVRAHYSIKDQNQGISTALLLYCATRR